jgi:hypothetical protein
MKSGSSRQARSQQAGYRRMTSIQVDQLPYFVTNRRVGVTVLVGAIGEIENVSHVFHPAGRLA